MINAKDFGATGNGRTLDTRSLQAAINAAAQSGGGTVYLPPGTYLTGSIFLASHITLHIDAGAVVLGSENPADYPVVTSRWEGIETETHAALIWGDHLSQIAIVGRGTIDGHGEPWWERHRAKSLRHPRPRLISFADCSDVLIEGITATRSPSWTIHPLRCDNVTIDRVNIFNPADSPNTDGIDPDSCHNVHIANCHIDVGDDCIAIKSGTEQIQREERVPSENITITNCTMLHGHGGVVIGSEMSGGVRNVVISNCVFVDTDRGIRLKSRRGRGGVVEYVSATNIVMRDVLCPFTMNLYYHIGVKGNTVVSDLRALPVTEDTPRFRHIHVSHIDVHHARYAAGYLYGLAEMPLEDISFQDVTVSMMPGAEPGPPDMADNIPPMARAGFIVANVVGLELDNVRVTGQDGPALQLTNTQPASF